VRQSACAAVLALLLGSSPALAQLPALGLPRGVLRAEVGGALASADQRYNDGEREDVLGDPSDAFQSRGELRLGLAAGVLGNVTAFAAAPFVRTRTRSGADIQGATVFLSGDAEVGAVLTAIDGWDPAERAGGLRLAARGTLRLPSAGDPPLDEPLALRPGDGQTDVEVDAALDFGRGAIGARATARYTLQLASTRETRVQSPADPPDLSAPIASVNLDPGDEVALGIRPFLRLAPGLALTGRMEYLSRGEDQANYEGTGVPGIDASVLETGTRRTAFIVGGGVSYVSPLAQARPSPRPVDAFLEVVGVAGSGEGLVPAAISVNIGLRMRFRVWGAPEAP
jgi:hypothetical protein